MKEVSYAPARKGMISTCSMERGIVLVCVVLICEYYGNITVQRNREII